MSLLTYRSGAAGMAALCAAIFVVGAADLQAQGLPDIPLADNVIANPAGTQVVAAWRSTNRFLSYTDPVGETPGYYSINYTTAWESGGASPYSANFTAAGGTYQVSSTMMQMGLLYPMSASSSTVGVTGYTGSAFNGIYLQFDGGYTTSVNGELNDKLATLSPVLTIGGVSYDLNDVSYFFSDRTIYDHTNTEDMYSDFAGFGLRVAQITIGWDLAALGYTGSLEDFSITLNHAAHAAVGDMQLSVAPIPEPSTFALIGAAGAAMVFVRRRRKA